MSISCAAYDLQDEYPKPPALYNGLKYVFDSIEAVKESLIVHQRQVCQVVQLCELCNAL